VTTNQAKEKKKKKKKEKESKEKKVKEKREAGRRVVAKGRSRYDARRDATKFSPYVLLERRFDTLYFGLALPHDRIVGGGAPGHMDVVESRVGANALACEAVTTVPSHTTTTTTSTVTHGVTGERGHDDGRNIEKATLRATRLLDTAQQ
jgi:hypothetical protein